MVQMIGRDKLQGIVLPVSLPETSLTCLSVPVQGNSNLVVLSFFFVCVKTYKPKVICNLKMYKDVLLFTI